VGEAVQIRSSSPGKYDYLHLKFNARISEVLDRFEETRRR